MQQDPSSIARLEQDIARYLLQDPGFFERHQHLLTAMQFSSSNSQRVINLQERQAEMLRGKVRTLEQQLAETIQCSQSNSTTASQVLLWAAHLFLHTDCASLPARICQDMMDIFAVPQAAIRIWDARPEWNKHAFAQGVSDDIRIFTSSLSAPYCGEHVGVEAIRWLDAPSQVASLALIPLKLPVSAQLPDGMGQTAFGLLVLASSDPQRYTSDMGTEYLQRIGDIASAVLSRLLPAEQIRTHTQHYNSTMLKQTPHQAAVTPVAPHTSDGAVGGHLPTLTTPYDV